MQSDQNEWKTSICQRGMLIRTIKKLQKVQIKFDAIIAKSTQQN